MGGKSSTETFADCLSSTFGKIVLPHLGEEMDPARSDQILVGALTDIVLEVTMPVRGEREEFRIVVRYDGSCSLYRSYLSVGVTVGNIREVDVLELAEEVTEMLEVLDVMGS